MSNGSGYIKSLDGARAISMILIMTFHADIAHVPWISVQLFFVLSGFLITGILWREKSKPDNLAFKFKKFWVRRSFRIFPLYYGFLFLLLLGYLIFHFPSYFNSYFPSAVTYTINFKLAFFTHGNPIFHHLWTLSIEEQFYLLFPLVILLSPRRFIKYLLVAILVLSPVIRYILGEYFKARHLPDVVVSDAVNFNTLGQLDAFCSGGIIAVFSLHTRVFRPWLWMGLIFAVFLVAGAINYLLGSSTIPYWNDLGYNHYLIDNYQHVWHYTLVNLLFASLILVLVSVYSTSFTAGLRRLLENKWLVRMGKVSYGMYIYHWMIWAYLFNNLFHTETWSMRVIVFLPYLAVVYGFSELSYRLYEYKFIQLKDKFYPDKKSVAPKQVVQAQ